MSSIPDNIDSPDWEVFIKYQLQKAGFSEAKPVPYYELSIPGQNAHPDRPKPPLLVPVVKPDPAFLEEHGQYGRYDQRSHMKLLEGMYIPTFEEEEGLDRNNGVFQSELFHCSSHFNVHNGFSVAEDLRSLDFGISDIFEGAVTGKQVSKKLQEIAAMVQNSAERTGLDISQIGAKEWAGLFRNSEAIILGKVTLPDVQFDIIVGAYDCRFTGNKIVPFPVVHSIVSQIHTRPVMEEIYHEPPAVWLHTKLDF